MALKVDADAAGNRVNVKISGRLSRADYERFVPEIERLIDREGKIRVLVEMDHFHGWTPGALWEDVKFDLRHFSDIERVAMVGDARWERLMARFCMPFTRATVRYFDDSKADEAERWLTA